MVQLDKLVFRVHSTVTLISSTTEHKSTGVFLSVCRPQAERARKKSLFIPRHVIYIMFEIEVLKKLWNTWQCHKLKRIRRPRAFSKAFCGVLKQDIECWRWCLKRWNQKWSKRLFTLKFNMCPVEKSGMEKVTTIFFYSFICNSNSPEIKAQDFLIQLIPYLDTT